MKMEPTVGSEMSAIRTQTPKNYPKRNKLHLEHGESLKTRFDILFEVSLPRCDGAVVWQGCTESLESLTVCFVRVDTGDGGRIIFRNVPTFIPEFMAPHFITNP